MLLAYLKISDPPSEVVVVRFDRSARLRDLGKARAAGPRPARFVRPLVDLLFGRLALIAYVDRGWRALEDVEFADDLGQLRNGLDRGGTGPDDADPLALQGNVASLAIPWKTSWRRWNN